jgi:hypothetical protein
LQLTAEKRCLNLAIFSCLKLQDETGAREREKKKRRGKERKKRGEKEGRNYFPHSIFAYEYEHH